ncbi:MAG: hypothetical protein MUO77_01980 [Anaerolineales bacterium]|nr:hypothetical protein [Anaerolineales bacterium]
MKSNIYKFFLFSFLLASCVVATPEATPTSTITPTFTSTLTPLPTLTLTPDPMDNWKNYDVTQVGFNLAGKQEIVPAVTEDGTYVYVKVGGDSNNEKDIVARWTEVKLGEWDIVWEWYEIRPALFNVSQHYDFYKDNSSLEKRTDKFFATLRLGQVYGQVHASAEYPEVFKEKGSNEIIQVGVITKSANYEDYLDTDVIDLFYEKKSFDGGCAVDGVDCNIVGPIRIRNYVNPWDDK